ncbi:MAG: hypothetical protein AAF587_21575 [Bacteroidota bacterium]
MKYLACILFIIGPLFGCNSSSPDSLSNRKADRFVFGQEKGAMIKWQLLKTYDPYEDGYVMLPEENNPHFLTFFRDGRFLEYDNRNYNDGSYLIHESKKSMALIYDIQNGIRVPPHRKDSLFRYQFLLQETDSLKLGILGRHGLVEKTYYKVIP